MREISTMMMARDRKAIGNTTRVANCPPSETGASGLPPPRRDAGLWNGPKVVQEVPMHRRGWLTTLTLLLLLHGPAFADSKSHRLALQISDDAPEKMNAVLNVAANVSRYYSERGEEVAIEVIAFNAGLHMLRADTSPVQERIAGFRNNMTNVRFKACQNTLEGMEKRETRSITLLPGVEKVSSGVPRLLELAEAGWVIIRP